MSIVEFNIPGRITGKGRPRFARVGDAIRTFTDKRTLNTEALIRSLASVAMRGRLPFSGPVELRVYICLNPAASWSNKRKRETIWVTGRPDADNILKVVGDALNRVVFNDDAQVASIIFQRTYVSDMPERVRVVVSDLGGANDVDGRNG